MGRYLELLTRLPQLLDMAHTRLTTNHVLVKAILQYLSTLHVCFGQVEQILQLPDLFPRQREIPNPHATAIRSSF